MLLALALFTELPEQGRTPLVLWQLILSPDAGHAAQAVKRFHEGGLTI